MWITAPKMWKTLWIKCGNVENMWKTCGKLICMCKCAKLSATIQTKVNFFLFSFFFFFFFSFSCTGTYVSVCGYVCVCGGALQLYALARRHGTWEKNVQWVAVYRSNENGGAYIFKIRYICIYKCLIFLSVREFSLGLSVVI